MSRTEGNYRHITEEQVRKNAVKEGLLEGAAIGVGTAGLGVELVRTKLLGKEKLDKLMHASAGYQRDHSSEITKDFVLINAPIVAGLALGVLVYKHTSGRIRRAGGSPFSGYADRKNNNEAKKSKKVSRYKK